MARLLAIWLWLSLPGTLFGQNSIFERYTTDDGLPSNLVYDAILGNDGQFWFATDNGIAAFNGLSFTNYGTSEGLLDREILGLRQDNQGVLWCFTSQGRLFYMEGNRFLPHPANRDLMKKTENRIINDLYFDAGGMAWVSTVIGGGLFTITKGSSEVTSFEPEEGLTDPFYVYKIDAKGVISGSASQDEEGNKVRAIIGDNSYSITLPGERNYSRTSCILLQNGTYLFAKEYELVNLTNTFVLARAFVEKNVEDVLEDSKGRIWAALLQGGVICFPNGSISAGGEISYLGQKTIHSIMEDNTGGLWMTTAGDGIYYLPSRPTLQYEGPQVFTPTDDDGKVEQVESRTTNVEPVKTFLPGSRVIGTETNDTIPPSIHITGLKIVLEEMPIQEHYDLGYDQNYLRIQYAGLSFNNNEKLQYRYRMDGVDDDWIYTSNAFVQYTTLPPGNYTFQVSAMNKYGIWSEDPALITFTIHPPYYRTWWFITLCIVGGVLLVVGSFFLYLRQVRRKERERAEINRKLAASELQALRAQMNPHFIFNTLSSIQHYITAHNTESAIKYLSKFAKLMRTIMENSKKPVIPLKDEIRALELYLELESMRFKDKFTYAIEVDPSVDKNYDAIPSMLIQPYIENAILHGIMNKAGKGHIGVSIKKDDNLVMCMIEDDGVGRERSREINQSKNNTHKSRGLSITRERLKILNASNHSELNVEIIDKKDSEGKANGTCVKVFIPVENG